MCRASGAGRERGAEGARYIVPLRPEWVMGCARGAGLLRARSLRARSGHGMPCRYNGLRFARCGLIARQEELDVV